MNTAKVLTVKVCVFYLILIFLLTGCDIGGEIEQGLRPAVEILNESILKLQGQSISWQQILQETREELIKNAHTTIANDVSNLMTRAISDAGVEVRCYTDFLRDRVKEDLIRLRAKITGEALSLIPVFCVPNPRTIDFALVQEGLVKAIEIDGYNLDVANIKVYLVDDQNQRTDVTTALASPTRYLITLNLGSNGVPLNPQSNKIIFELPANQEQSVNIIQPLPQETSDAFTPPPSEKFCPDRIAGDREFNGNGPDVSASAVLFTKNESELWVRISLHVIETKSDWSEAAGDWEYALWSGPIGATITDYAPTAPSTAEYRDDNHQPDRPSVSGSGLVQRFEINGDTEDDDIGNCTNDDVYIQVHFGEIQVKYVEK